MGFAGALSPFGPLGFGVGIIPPPPIPAPAPVLLPSPAASATGAVVVIPTDHSTPQIPPYSQKTVLSQVTYGLAFRWNARANVWTAAVSAANGTLLADAIPIRNGLPIAQFAATTNGFPPGNFWAVPVDHDPADAGQDQLGGRVLLTYIGANA